MSEHGVDCRKVPHLGSGWLHGEDDDQPYSVDGVRYCGRCHSEMGTAMRTTASDGNSLDTARAQIASLIAERDELRAMLAGQCETCAGTGIMEASSDGGATYSAESCAECKGSGKGWMADALRDTRATALREAAAYIDRVESHLRGYMSGEALLATFHIPKDTA